jgi:hypothetical protein
VKVVCRSLLPVILETGPSPHQFMYHWWESKGAVLSFYTQICTYSTYGRQQSVTVQNDRTALIQAGRLPELRAAAPVRSAARALEGALHYPLGEGTRQAR